MEAGRSEPAPFDDRDGVATPEFYERLVHLRRVVGGWLYRDPETVRVVRVPDPLPEVGEGAGDQARRL